MILMFFCDFAKCEVPHEKWYKSIHVVLSEAEITVALDK